MSSDCPCKRCEGRFVARPKLLRAFDNTRAIRKIQPPTPVLHIPRNIIPGTPSCYCECDRCVARLQMGKAPVHLKRLDNTTQSPDIHDFQIETVRNTVSPSAIENSKVLHRCLGRCFECRNTLPINPEQVEDLEHTTCARCPAALKEFDQCHCTDGRWPNDKWPAVPGSPSVSGCVYEEIAMQNVNGVESVDYDRCTLKALKHLVERRGFKDPYHEGLTLRYIYTRILRAADETYCFRFRDLPPELRNSIYDYLLIDSEGYESCHPQILSTCRAIHNEATGILYAENRLRCEIKLKHYWDGTDMSFWCGDFELHKQEYTMQSTDEYGEYYQFTGTRSLMPIYEQPAGSKFHKIGTLDINICISNLGDFDAHQSNQFKTRGIAQNCLLAFASSLMGQHRLKNININFICYDDASWSPPDGSAWAKAILYPLRRLRGIKNVEITGETASPWVEEMVREMQSDEPAFNTWKQVCRVKVRLQPYLELIRTHYLEDFAGQWAKFDELLYLASLLLLEFEPNQAVFVDENHEADVRAGLVDLEKLLEGLGPVDSLFARLSKTA